ncbi:MAG: sterol desaturase family protein [Nitrospinota bacterium]
MAVSAGWILAYSVYEALHWLFHSGDPEGGLGRLPSTQQLWAAHTVHHLHRANKNYGFITMFWDKCFGTYLPLEHARARGGGGIRAAGSARGDRGQE